MAQHHWVRDRQQGQKGQKNTKGHLHRINTQAQCVLNVPGTEAPLLFIRTKNLAVTGTKT